MNKPYLYLFALLILTGCEEPLPQATEELKNLPKTETALIEQFNAVKTKIFAEHNEVAEKELIDSGEVQISNFVRNSLKGKAEKWHAYVYEVRKASMLETTEDNVYVVSVLVPLKKPYYRKEPKNNAMTLVCLVKGNNKGLMSVIKKLRPFNKVLITGTFKAENNGDITFMEPLTIDHARSFQSPEFILDLKSIEKLQE